MTWDWRRAVHQLTPTAWIVIAAVLLGAFFRLWNFSNSLQFLGDQGRDAIISARIFREKDIVLIGPVTSNGNMYLGPLYYYFMAPFLFLSYPSPLGPAYAVAGLSILTTALMYVLGREIVGSRAALFATVLFAFSSVVVEFARFSWNPNPAPLFGLLCIWCLFRTQKKQYWFWVGVSASLAVLTQLHYVALLLMLVAGLVWLKQVFLLRAVSFAQKKQFGLATLSSIVLFILSLTPLIAFDVRHEWLNVRSLQKFLGTSQEALAAVAWWEKPLRILIETFRRAIQLFFEISIGPNLILNTLLLVGAVGLLAYLALKKKSKYSMGYQLLAFSYVICVCGLGFYRGIVYHHYVAFFFPMTFLIFGSFLDWMAEFEAGKSLVIICLLGYLIYNVSRMPIQSTGWTITDMQRTTQTITDRVKPGEKYNFVLLSDTKDYYGENYRYFLSTTATPPLRIEDFGRTETLFIIDEQQTLRNATDSPVYEIVVFPNKKPTEVYTIPGGPRITVLRKNQ